jgi:molecular chaperone DnaK
MDQPSSPDDSGITLRIKFKSESVDQFIARYGTDVSPGGIFIRTRDPLGVGTALRFEFSLVDGTPLLVGQGTVVWVREHDQARAGVVPGMGVRFDKLTAHSQTVLGTILAGKARRDREGLGGTRESRRSTPTTSIQKQPSSSLLKGGGIGGGSLAGSDDPTAVVPGMRTQPGLGDRQQKVLPPSPSPSPSPALSSPRSPSPSSPVSPLSAKVPEAMRPAPVMAPQKPVVTQPLMSARPSSPPAASAASPPASMDAATPVRLPRLSQPVPPMESEDRLLRGAPVEKVTEPARPTPAMGSAASSSDPWQADKTEIALLPPSFIAESRRDDSSSTEALSMSGAFDEIPLRPEPAQPVASRPPPPPDEATASGRGEDEVDAAPGSGWETALASERRVPGRVHPTPAFGDGRPSVQTAMGRAGVEFGNGARDGFEEAETMARSSPLRPMSADARMRTTTPGIGDPYPPMQPSRPPGAEYHESPRPSSPSPVLFPQGHEEAATDPFNRGGGDQVSVTGEVPRPGRAKMWAVIGVTAVGMAVFGFFAMQKLKRQQEVAAGGEATPVVATAEPAPAAPAPAQGEPTPPSQPAAPSAAAPAPSEATPPAPAAPAGGGVPAPTEVAVAKAPGAAPTEPAAPTPAPSAPPAARPAARPEVAAAKPAPAAAAPSVRSVRGAKPRPRPGAAGRPAGEEGAGGEIAQAGDPAGAAGAAPGAVPGAGTGAAPTNPNAIEDPFSTTEDIYWLRVRSTPAGADVLIDGQLEGKTPFQRRIFDSSRPYALTVRKPGYEPHEQMLSASDEWQKKGNVRTLTISPKLAKAKAGSPAASESTGAPAGEVPPTPPADTAPAEPVPAPAPAPAPPPQPSPVQP